MFEIFFNMIMKVKGKTKDNIKGHHIENECNFVL